jgi:predicted ATPase
MEQTIGAVSIEETDHYRLMREFCADPQNFVESVLTDQ